MSSETFSLPSPKRRELLAKATSEYAESVELAQPYLTSRGLAPETAADWQLGYVLDPIPGHEKFKNYLSIPYVTPAGVIEMKFRCIASHVDEAGSPAPCEGHPKYNSESGGGTYLFGIRAFWEEADVMCITEGELDAITANAAGIPAVGISGATKWLPHWAYCFEGYEEVVVLRDPDKAGEKLASNVSSALNNGCRVITFPEGEDVNSFYLKHGAQALRERCGLGG